MSMQYKDKIYIAGHRGMVGSAIVRLLTKRGYSNLLTAERSELELMSQQQVTEFFATHQPDYVFLAAAKVGGIQANNSYPADFIYDNLMIQNNIIHAAHQFNVKRLLFLGSSCIYPKNAHQPMIEDSLLSGQLEPTNEPYAIAK
ncbi:NAD-dependent epimerase/dehydratase family protein, partial [Psychrobacter sp. 1Y4]|uniref:NAD-dependent epimerase/dehydratase family protein n=1 Tax=Psychrobacter sp. 1Y4 TaxID=3453575 RepID=UPI003F446093